MTFINFEKERIETLRNKKDKSEEEIKTLKSLEKILAFRVKQVMDVIMPDIESLKAAVEK